MTVPQTPAVTASATWATNADDIIGLMANGVPLAHHTPTWTYDDCTGHSGDDHQYHYHLAPFCAMFDYTSATKGGPTSFDWWVDGNKVKNYSTMGATFAAEGDFVVSGIARDGFSIYGAYDAARMLQRGSGYAGSTLDKCNGKVGADGLYGYYFTPDPPFSPPCLMGTKGSLEVYATSTKCPASGISNTVTAAAAIADSTGGTTTDVDSAAASVYEVAVSAAAAAAAFSLATAAL